MSNCIFQPPKGLGWSVTRRPKYGTLTQNSVSGRSQLRVAKQTWPIWEYEMVWNYLKGGAQSPVLTNNDFQALMGFYLARQGAFDSFLFSDPNDNSVSGMPFATGDGSTTAFQMQRNIGQGVDIVQNVDASVSPPSIFKSDFQGIKNLLTYSDGLVGTGTNLTGQAMAWFNNGIFPTIATPNAAMAPDGSNNATKLTLAAATDGVNWSGWMQQINTSSSTTGPLAGRTFTFSVWMRADAALSVTILTDSGSPAFQQASASCSLTTRWQRFSVTIAYTVTDQDWRVFLRNGSAASQTFYIWGAQFEESSSATTYQSVGAVQGGPTPQYATARTNVITSSQDFTNAAWLKGASVTPSANAALAPDGSNTANLITIAAGAGGNANALHQGVGTSLSGIYVLTFWIKGGTGTNGTIVEFGIFDDSTSAWQFGSASVLSGPGMASGTTSAVVSGLSTSRWTKVQYVTSPLVSGHTYEAYLYCSGSANTGAATQYLWGCQVEAGNATSYIRTLPTPTTVTDYSLGSTGIVTFATAPASGALLTWTGSYYYRLHFSDDSNDFEEFMYQLHTLRKVKFESIIL